MLPTALFLALVLIALASLLWAAQRRRARALERWHRQPLTRELGAPAAPSVTTWADYLALEEALFAEVEEKLVRPGGEDVLDRYRAGSASHPDRQPVPGNRSFELEAAAPRGAVLLLHGLTDSPYSVRSLAALFARHGLTAVAPRLPGHGTAPGEIARRGRREWRAAATIGARRAQERAAGGALYLVGYSTGAPLALDLVLSGRLAGVARIFLISPALGLGPAAALAGLHRLYSFLPGLAGGRWVHVRPEIEPFKYNSFPKTAAAEAHRLISKVVRRLRRADGAGLPPVTVFQSVDDATVDARAVPRLLDAGLFPANTELILFDRDRSSVFESLRRPRPSPVPETERAREGLPYRLTVVAGGAGPGTAIARTWPAGGGPAEEEPLRERWPDQVHSLSHVALPFPPDDPLYGFAAPAGGPGLGLGRWTPRGERGRLRLPAGHLLRLRSNPFYGYLEGRIAAHLEGG
ncbi:MAG: alpha/beta fold hydrolase [Thermoanaerobaculia bacterium]|nr:alpha/beta fold hydrolase [Thermoanaerobaculia bacterium]